MAHTIDRDTNFLHLALGIGVTTCSAINITSYNYLTIFTVIMYGICGAIIQFQVELGRSLGYTRLSADLGQFGFTFTLYQLGLHKILCTFKSKIKRDNPVTINSFGKTRPVLLMHWTRIPLPYKPQISLDSQYWFLVRILINLMVTKTTCNRFQVRFVWSACSALIPHNTLKRSYWNIIIVIPFFINKSNRIAHFNCTPLIEWSCWFLQFDFTSFFEQYDWSIQLDRTSFFDQSYCVIQIDIIGWFIWANFFIILTNFYNVGRFLNLNQF